MTFQNSNREWNGIIYTDNFSETNDDGRDKYSINVLSFEKIPTCGKVTNLANMAQFYPNVTDIVFPEGLIELDDQPLSDFKMLKRLSIQVCSTPDQNQINYRLGLLEKVVPHWTSRCFCIERQSGNQVIVHIVNEKNQTNVDTIADVINALKSPQTAQIVEPQSTTKNPMPIISIILIVLMMWYFFNN